MRLARRWLDPALAPFLWSRAAIWGGADPLLLLAPARPPERARADARRARLLAAPLGELGRRLVHPGREARVRARHRARGVLSALPVAARRRRARLLRALRRGGRRHLARRGRCGLRAAAAAHCARAGGGHRAPRDRPACDLPALLLLAGGVQRVALSRARARRVLRGAPRTLGARGRGDRARLPDAADGGRALDRRARARLALAGAPTRACVDRADAARVRDLPARALAAERRRARLRARGEVLAPLALVARPARRHRRRRARRRARCARDPRHADAGRLDVSGESESEAGRRGERRGVRLARALPRADGRRLASPRRGLRDLCGAQPRAAALGAVERLSALLAAALRARRLSVLHGARSACALTATLRRADRLLDGAARGRRRALGALALGAAWGYAASSGLPSCCDHQSVPASIFFGGGVSSVTSSCSMPARRARLSSRSRSRSASTSSVRCFSVSRRDSYSCVPRRAGCAGSRPPRASARARARAGRARPAARRARPRDSSARRRAASKRLLQLALPLVEDGRPLVRLPSRFLGPADRRLAPVQLGLARSKLELMLGKR